MAEFADELLASDPRDLCGCKFRAPVSDGKMREQCQLEKQSGKRRAREDDE